MKTRVSFLAAILFFLPVLGWADHPSTVTKSAIPIEKNAYRAEAGAQFNRHSSAERNSLISFSILYGLIHNMEVGVELPYLWATAVPHHNDHDSDQMPSRDSDRLGDLSLLAKVLFLKGRDATPISMAGAMRLKIPTASRNRLTDTTGEADIGLSLITSKAMYPYDFYLNLSHTYLGNPAREERPDRRDYVLGIRYAAAKPNLSYTGELLGQDYTGRLAEDEWSFAGGASYAIAPEIGIDSAIAIGLSKHAAAYGLNFRIRYDYN